jgi:hypothetical protein
VSSFEARRRAKRISSVLLRGILGDRDTKSDIRFGPDLLRLSQKEAMHEAARFLRDGVANGHIIQPGGTGKLHEIVMLSDACCRTGGKAIIVVPTKYAVRNTLKRFEALAPHIKIGAVYEEAKDYDQQVTVITYASLLISLAKGKIKPKNYALLLADEGHHFLTELSEKTLNAFSCAAKIAFTATPRYYAGKELSISPHFGQLFYNLTYKEAVERKECTPTKARLIDTNVTLAEYELLFAKGSQPSEDSAAYEHAVNQTPWNQTFVDLYQSYTDEETGHRFMGDKTLVFSADIQHAKDIAGQFNDILMPYINGRLKYTEEGWDIREALEAKGINPDKVKFVCAPLWGAMDREGGWPNHEVSKRSYSQDELMRAFEQGEVLCLSCDKLLAESIDMAEVTTVLNAVPTFSFVRAGQRGTRPGRKFNGDRKRRIPRKTWAYVFDGLPAGWQTSMAAPVLFSQFTLKDLYTMHGAEPPARNGPPKGPIHEHNPGYRVLWDVKTLLSIGTIMDAKRSIAKAEIVPQEFLNDSAAIRELMEQHKELTANSRRFIAGIFKEWEIAFKAAQQVGAATVTRYKYSIPVENFRFANNRLYIHRDSMPIILQERQAFLTPREMHKLLIESEFYTILMNVKAACGLIRSYWAGEYMLTEDVSVGSENGSAEINRRIKQNNELRAQVLPTIGKADLRRYESSDFISIDLLPALKVLTKENRHYYEEMQAQQQVAKNWTSVVSLIEKLADAGFDGLGRIEILTHAVAAFQAAERGESYGGEDLFPSEFRFSARHLRDSAGVNLNDFPYSASARVHIRNYRVSQFIDALTQLHPPKYAEPSQFPATLSECFSALRRQAANELTWRGFGKDINNILHARAERQKRLKEVFNLSSADLVAPESPREQIRITRDGYKNYKNLLAMKPPVGFIGHDRLNEQITKLTGGVMDWKIHRQLHDAILANPERTGTIEIAGVSIPLNALWNRDPYAGPNDSVVEGLGIFYGPSVVPSLVMLCAAANKIDEEIVNASKIAPDQVKDIVVRGITIPVASNYFNSNNARVFHTTQTPDDVFFRAVQTYITDMQLAVADLSSDFWKDRQARRAPRVSLQEGPSV